MLAFSNQVRLASACLVVLNIAFVQEVGIHVCVRVCVRPEPIMLLELPIMLLSIISKTSLLCSKLCF